MHEAALRHLSRFAATEAGLVRVLDRRIARWAREAGADAEAAAPARAAAREVARALAGAGVVDDAAFAKARARRLTRAGRSRRAVSAHLAAKGVAADLAASVLPDAEQELAAALAYARRRRLGPFAVPDSADTEEHRRALGALARAGFPQPVAEQALRTALDDALSILARMRQA